MVIAPLLPIIVSKFRKIQEYSQLEELLAAEATEDDGKTNATTEPSLDEEDLELLAVATEVRKRRRSATVL